MGEFQRMNGRAVAQPVVGVAGSTLALKYIPAQGEALPAGVLAAPANVAKTSGVNRRVGPHFISFTLEFGTAGEAKLWAGASATPPAGAAVPVSVITRLGWPASGTTRDALTRLFIAETPAPGTPGYTDALAEQTMTWMWLVLRNRLALASARVGSAGARNLIDVIQARNQFEGFANYPTLTAGLQSRLSGTMAIANDPGDGRSAAMRRFIQIALRVADLSTATDPSPTGLYFWRTQGSGAPSADTVAFQSLMGNTFYTLK